VLGALKFTREGEGQKKVVLLVTLRFSAYTKCTLLHLAGKFLKTPILIQNRGNLLEGGKRKRGVEREKKGVGVEGGERRRGVDLKELERVCERGLSGMRDEERREEKKKGLFE
jgi:hypothetical protein